MLSRPEFDLTPADGAASPKARVLSVSDLNRSVRQTLERGFPYVTVQGEISNWVRAASGHIYFSLKDSAAQVRCTLWRSKASLADRSLKEGDQVEIRASVTLFEARGEFQLNVDSIKRAGAGALFEQFLRLKAKLEAEGLLDTDNKRALPTFPIGIGIVTSPDAAALHDVLTTLERRAPMIPVIVYPTPVQGAGAAERIAAAVRTASSRATQDRIDVLIVCRGGGSIEDLWAFNDEAVARAIAACSVPVVNGVGHETDFTIADFVADLRAPTPTAAAEYVSPVREALRNDLATAAQALARATQRILANQAQSLDWLQSRLIPPSARIKLQKDHLMRISEALLQNIARQRAARRLALEIRMNRLVAARPRPQDAVMQLQSLQHRLTRAAYHAQTRRTAALTRVSAMLESLNPQRVLERGYSITRLGDGTVVQDAAALRVGDTVELVLAKGRAQAEITRPPTK
jgi:exodeoxyribonuclease VII large subunit